MNLPILLGEDNPSDEKLAVRALPSVSRWPRSSASFGFT